MLLPKSMCKMSFEKIRKENVGKKEYNRGNREEWTRKQNKMEKKHYASFSRWCFILLIIWLCYLFKFEIFLVRQININYIYLSILSFIHNQMIRVVVFVNIRKWTQYVNCTLFIVFASCFSSNRCVFFLYKPVTLKQCSMCVYSISILMNNTKSIAHITYSSIHICWLSPHAYRFMQENKSKKKKIYRVISANDIWS